MSEHDEQVALFEWAERMSGRYPELSYLYAVPNGGHRHRATAAKLKAEGVKAGYPDIGLDVARWGYHGLRIELKVGDNKPTSAQGRWHDWLRKQRYCVALCYGWDEARDMICAYLGIEGEQAGTEKVTT